MLKISGLTNMCSSRLFDIAADYLNIS